jgi:PKD repeat protein
MLVVTLSLALVPSIATATVASFAQKALAGSAVSAASEGLASPYSQVSRFGGFDPTGKELGKFVLPVGFAVAPEEGNDVYVLDRVVNETDRLGYRLQKLSSTGTPLGSVTLPVQTYTNKNFSDANPLISLAVDSREKRVYAVVEGMVNTAEGTGEFEWAPVAQRLVAWDTEPVSKELVKAAGAYEEDPLTHAALIAGGSVLEPETSSEAGYPDDLYAPAGITINPTNHDVVIEAQQGVKEEAVGGPTILQSVTTKAPAGELGAKWVSGTGQPADGVFTTNNGLFGIDLYGGSGSVSDLADVTANLKESSPIAEDKSGGIDLDQASTIGNTHTINYRNEFNNGLILEPFTAGSPVAQLTNNLYAARYAVGVEALVNSQAEVAPWNEPGPIGWFWAQGGVRDRGIGNVGIRLFEESGHVVTTVGGEGPCKLETAQLSIAAGSEESVFVLTQPNEENGNKGDEVIQFKPAGHEACPEPSGEVKVDGVPASSVTVDQGVPVKFDASSIDRAGETPFAFEWDFEGGNTYSHVSKIEPPNYTWPSPTAEHTYDSLGEYEANVRLVGDYGTSVFPVAVTVVTAQPPVAAFKGSGAMTVGEKVAFDASESTPTPGSKIVKYEWEFGDGTHASTAVPKVEHAYASAKTYTVKLIVTDKVGHKAEITHEVIITEATQEKEPAKEKEPEKVVVVPPPPAPNHSSGPGGPAPGAASARIAAAVSRAGQVTVTVSCPAGNTTCAGTVQLQTAAMVAAGHGKRAQLLLGRASFDVAGGKSEVLHVHLSSKGLALLQKNHSVRAIATITTLAGSGRAQVTAHGDVTFRRTKGANGH